MQTTTTATRSVTQTQTNVNLAIRYDPSYLKTIPGIIKCVCVALNLLGFLCIIFSRYAGLSRSTFFNFVAMTGFWFTGALLLFYVFHVIERFFRIPWIFIELIFCAAWTLLYFIAAVWVATISSGPMTAAAFFGFCAMVAYGYDAWLKFVGFKNGDIAQGERRIVQQQTIVTQQTPSAFPA